MSCHDKDEQAHMMVGKGRGRGRKRDGKFGSWRCWRDRDIAMLVNTTQIVALTVSVSFVCCCCCCCALNSCVFVDVVVVAVAVAC